MTIYDSLKQTTRSLKNWSCRGRTDKVGYSVADSLLEIMQCESELTCTRSRVCGFHLKKHFWKNNSDWRFEAEAPPKTLGEAQV